jgi:hypothetical protein
MNEYSFIILQVPDFGKATKSDNETIAGPNAGATGQTARLVNGPLIEEEI